MIRLTPKWEYRMAAIIVYVWQQDDRDKISILLVYGYILSESQLFRWLTSARILLQERDELL